MLVRRSSNSKMRIFRLVLAAYYLFLAVGAAGEAWLLDSPLPHKYVYGLRLMDIVLSVIFALGAWTVWHERASREFYEDRLADYGKSHERSDGIWDSRNCLFLGRQIELFAVESRFRNSSHNGSLRVDRLSPPDAP